MLDTLERVIRARWAGLGLPGIAPSRVAFLLTSGPSDRHGCVTFRAFRDEETRPILVGKIARDGASRQWLTQEQELLSELEVAAPRLAGLQFPRALFLERTPNRLASGESPLAGVPLPEWAAACCPDPESRTAKIHERAKEWLFAVWRGAGLLDATEGALWEPTLRSAHFCLENFPATDACRAEFEALTRELESRRAEASLSSFGHGDCRAIRLLVRGPRVGAIQWQHGRRRQFPWFDPLHFAMEWSVRRGGGSLANGLELGFFRAGPLRDANRAFLSECFAEGGVREDVLPLALPAVLADHLHRRARVLPLDDPETRSWLECLERSLAPGARDELVEFWRARPAPSVRGAVPSEPATSLVAAAGPRADATAPPAGPGTANVPQADEPALAAALSIRDVAEPDEEDRLI